MVGGDCRSEPAGKAARRSSLVAVDRAVGPAAEHGADEALGLAVGAGPVGTGAQVLDPERACRRARARPSGSRGRYRSSALDPDPVALVGDRPRGSRPRWGPFRRRAPRRRNQHQMRGRRARHRTRRRICLRRPRPGRADRHMRTLTDAEARAGRGERARKAVLPLTPDAMTLQLVLLYRDLWPRRTRRGPSRRRPLRYNRRPFQTPAGSLRKTQAPAPSVPPCRPAWFSTGVC